MSRLLKSIPFCLAAMACALPAAVRADDNAAVTCSVTIDYERNNVLVERYTRDFTADTVTPYHDDFSTRIRFKTFSATVTRSSGVTVVAFDYYNDVGVFHAVAVNSSLSLRGGEVQSTSGRHNFYATNSTTPASVGGNHQTTYSLACRRV